MIDELLDRNVAPYKKLGIQLVFANEVLATLRSYGRLKAPERPDELPLDNEDLRDFIRRVGTSSRVSAADRELGDMFGVWRAAVFRTEGDNTARLETLMHVARVFELVAREHPAHGADGQAVIEFVSAEWGVHMPPIPTPIEAREIAPRVAHEKSVPMGLRDLDFYERRRSDRGGEPTTVGAGRQLSMEDYEEED